MDPLGAALPGAVVEIRRGEGLLQHLTGDGFGRAVIAVPEGDYLLTVSAPGFEPTGMQFSTVSCPASTMRVVMALAKQADSIEVQSEGYKAREQSSASRIPLALLETPQQVQVLTGELLRQRSVDSMKQAVEVVPAVGLQLGEGRRDNFFIRGFNAVGDMYLDGVRDDAQYYRDLSNTERIEIVEGPAAVLYGRGSSGGLINRVTKKPRLEGSLGELSMTYGSYGEERGAADLDTVVPGTNRKLGFRLTGAAESAGSQRHLYWEDRYTFAPTLTWRASEATSVTLQGERLRDDRLPDRGIPFLPATGAPAVVPVGNFYGYAEGGAGSNFIQSGVTDATFSVEHVTGQNWHVRAVQRVAGYTTDFANMYATAVAAIANSGGDYMVARGEYNGTQRWQTEYTNVEAYRTGTWLGLKHTVLAGVEYGREATDSTQYNGPSNQTPVDLFHPAQVAPVLSTVLSRNNRFLGQTAAIYAQDLISLGARWKMLIGLRGDDFRQTLELRPPTNTTPNLGRTDFAASPRVGVVYAVRAQAAVYGNYSRTFDPSGEGLSLASNNAALAPEVTQNVEAGAKYDLLRSRLLVTSSLFRLDRTNIKTTDPSNPLLLLNLGEQRTDGAELGFQGAPARRWQMFGGYAWLDGRIVSSTTASNGVSLQGRRPAMSALHNGSIWTTFTFDSGLGAGGGIVAKSAQFAATDNLARLPAFVREDITVFYRRPRYEVQANIENVTNVRYYDAAQSDYQIYPAAPVNGSVTARWRF